MELKTECQIKREIKHKKIAEEFIDLMQKGAAKETAWRILKKKYEGLESYNTLYRINKKYLQNQTYSLSKAIEKEELFEAIDKICADLKKS